MFPGTSRENMEKNIKIVLGQGAHSWNCSTVDCCFLFWCVPAFIMNLSAAIWGGGGGDHNDIYKSPLPKTKIV